ARSKRSIAPLRSKRSKRQKIKFNNEGCAGVEWMFTDWITPMATSTWSGRIAGAERKGRRRLADRQRHHRRQHRRRQVTELCPAFKTFKPFNRSAPFKTFNKQASVGRQ